MKMHDNNLIALPQSLANDSTPIIINNACVSWHRLASNFMFGGARGYVGTLFPISTTEAEDVLLRALRKHHGKVLPHAFWSAQREAYGDNPRRPYVVAGVYPQRIRATIAVVVLGVLVSACGYNTIPTLEEQAKAKWADVQNNYQRRADLIPNLVATVQGYAKQEKDVLTSVIEARAKATQIKIDASQLTDPDKLKQFQDAQNQLSGALGRLLAVTENYPDLKSNQNFLALQSQLEGTENRIATARRDYIESVRAYNTELKTFPGVLWAATAFRANKPMAEFAAGEGAQAPPQVKF